MGSTKQTSTQEEHIQESAEEDASSIDKKHRPRANTDNMFENSPERMDDDEMADQMMADCDGQSLTDSEEEGSPNTKFQALEKAINKQEGGMRKFTKLSS